MTWRPISYIMLTIKSVSFRALFVSCSKPCNPESGCLFPFCEYCPYDCEHCALPCKLSRYRPHACGAGHAARPHFVKSSFCSFDATRPTALSPSSNSNDRSFERQRTRSKPAASGTLTDERIGENDGTGKSLTLKLPESVNRSPPCPGPPCFPATIHAESSSPWTLAAVAARSSIHGCDLTQVCGFFSAAQSHALFKV